MNTWTRILKVQQKHIKKKLYNRQLPYILWGRQDNTSSNVIHVRVQQSCSLILHILLLAQPLAYDFGICIPTVVQTNYLHPGSAFAYAITWTTLLLRTAIFTWCKEPSSVSLLYREEKQKLFEDFHLPAPKNVFQRHLTPDSTSKLSPSPKAFLASILDSFWYQVKTFGQFLGQNVGADVVQWCVVRGGIVRQSLPPEGSKSTATERGTQRHAGWECMGASHGGGTFWRTLLGRLCLICPPPQWIRLQKIKFS